MTNSDNVKWLETVNTSIDAYKTNPQYDKVYERYDFLYEQIKANHSIDDTLDVLDIGCGDSSFIYYLKKKHPHFSYTGIDYSQELIDIAKQEPFLQDITLIQGDAKSFYLDKKFDIVILSGVLSIFDDIEQPLATMCKHIKTNAYGYIFGGFNQKDIDVLIRYKNNYKKKDIWESGLNTVSLSTMNDLLSKYSNQIKIERFYLKQDLEEVDDPIRTYTIETKDKGKIVLNGANIVREHYAISFKITKNNE